MKTALGQLPASNQRPVDPFSLGHVAVGFAIAQTRAPWWVALFASVGWELSENFLKAKFPQFFPAARRDSRINAGLDVVFLMAGWAAGRKITYGKLTGPAGPSRRTLF